MTAIIGSGEILDHLLAVAVIWIAALAGGLMPALLLPVPSDRKDYLVACPILGCAWWTVSFYVFSFPGGLLIASAITAVLAILAGVIIIIRRRRRIIKNRASPIAAVVLIIGCSAFATPIFTQHVPFGLESWKATSNAMKIGANVGMLPVGPDKSYYEDRISQGQPVLPGLAVRIGCTPISSMLAIGQFTMSLLILSTYLLLRFCARRKTAAIIAVASCWTMSGLQSMFVTGELAMLTTISLGLLCCRIILDYGRHSRLISIIPVGITIGAMPMINIFGTGCWVLFAAGPTAVFSLLFSRSRLQTLAAGLLGGASAALTAGVTFIAAKAELDAGNYLWIRPTDFEFGLIQDALLNRLKLGWYMVDYVGPVLIIVASVSMVSLIMKKRWAAMIIFLLPVSLLITAAVISIYWLRPGAQVLGPRHDFGWLGPACALAIAMAWRWGILRIRSRRWGSFVAIIFLAAGFAGNAANFQARAFQPVVDENVWQGLKWAAARLDPEKDLVFYMYDTPGSYLPAMCGVKAVTYTDSKDSPGQYKSFTCVFVVDSEGLGPKSLPHYQASENYVSKILARKNSPSYQNDRVRIYMLGDEL